MATKDILKHDDYSFTFEQLTDKSLIFTVQREGHSAQETYLNAEACIELARRLLNAAKGLE